MWSLDRTIWDYSWNEVAYKYLLLSRLDYVMSVVASALFEWRSTG